MRTPNEQEGDRKVICSRRFWAMISRIPAHWAIAGMMLVASGGATATAGSLPEKIVFTSPGTGSAIGLLSEVIKENRLDERNGIVLELEYLDPAAMERAVLLGRADAGIFPVLSAARVNLIGRKLRLFAPALINHNSVVLQKGSTAIRLADLKGKRVGTLDRISMNYTTLDLIARMHGLDIEREFKLTLSNPAVLMGLFERGELDALVIHEPLVTRLVSEGHLEMMRLDEVWRKETGQPMVALAIGAYEDWIKTHAEAARKLFQTVTDAIAIIQKNPKDVIAEHRESLSVKTEQQLVRLTQRMPQFYPTRWDRALIENMVLLLRKNVEFGLLEKMPNDEIFVILK